MVRSCALAFNALVIQTTKALSSDPLPIRPWAITPPATANPAPTEAERYAHSYWPPLSGPYVSREWATDMEAEAVADAQGARGVEATFLELAAVVDAPPVIPPLNLGALSALAAFEKDLRKVQVK